MPIGHTSDAGARRSDRVPTRTAEQYVTALANLIGRRLACPTSVAFRRDCGRPDSVAANSKLNIALGDVSPEKRGLTDRLMNVL